MAALKVKIAETPEEIRSAFMLRFEVFEREMKEGAGSPAPAGLEQDAFDRVCDHLIIVDTLSGKVIGTYRMLLDSVARANNGFYSETKFNIDCFKRLNGRLLEVGRSCVHRDYRNKTVLNLLWHGITQYAMAHRVEYIFGSANIMTDDPQTISRFFCMFKALGLYQEMGVTPADSRQAVVLDSAAAVKNPKELFSQLPQLFKAYMKVGLKVCGAPVMGDFHSAVFPVLLDIRNTSEAYRRHFFGDYLKKTSPADRGAAENAAA